MTFAMWSVYPGISAAFVGKDWGKKPHGLQPSRAVPAGKVRARLPLGTREGDLGNGE